MSSGKIREWLLLLLCLPGKQPEPAGILLLDSVSNRLDIKLKPMIDTEDQLVSAVWAELSDDLRQKAEEMGGAWVVAWLEETASHIIQISSRRSVAEGQGVEDLYSDHVDQAYHKELSRGTGA